MDENRCLNCGRDLDEMGKVYESVKDSVSEDRHYIFDEYYSKKRTVCIKCYIEAAITIQSMLTGKGVMK